MPQPRRIRPNRIQIFITIGVIIVGALAAFIYWDAWYRNWNYTGFGPKTLWDWLQLLIIPAVLALAGFLYNRQEKQSDRAIAERRAQSDHAIAERRAQSEREIAEDGLRESALQSYFDRMTELILDEDLANPQLDAKVRAVARSRTLSVLRRLDPDRRTAVFRFLVESGLVEPSNVIVGLAGADLSYAELSVANLSYANLTQANLSGAKLSYAKLRDAKLSGAKLSGANLSYANLIGANLTQANLSYANLTQANLTQANLRGADLRGADLTGAIYTTGTYGTKWPTPNFNPQEHGMVLREDN